MIADCPLPQVPFCPPKPSTQKVYIPKSKYEENMKCLHEMEVHTDVVIVAGGREKESKSFCAHKFLLAAAVPSMYKLFTMDLSSDVPSRRASDSSIVSFIFFLIKLNLGTQTNRA